MQDVLVDGAPGYDAFHAELIVSVRRGDGVMVSVVQDDDGELHIVPAASCKEIGHGE